MPLKPGSGRGIVSANISEMMHSGFPQKQAVAASLSNARRHPHARGGIAGYDDGGGVPAGGIAPSADTASPSVQNQMDRYSAMDTEQLAELVARLGPDNPQSEVAQRVLMQKRVMPHRADGGDIPGQLGPLPSTAVPEATTLLHSTVPGRTDHIKTSVAPGSYVVPADVVSGVGEGNTLAGAQLLQHVLEAGPYGVALPKSGRHGSNMPRPPKPRARGGAADGEPVPIMGAGGELVVHPKHVALWGGGNVKRGHKMLDHWVVATRKEIAKEMLKLPPPVKE